MQQLQSMRYGAFLSKDVLETFHAQDFNISQAEAERMDPLQRLLLEVSYEALVDAEHSINDMNGQRVGVFVAASGSVDSRNVLVSNNLLSSVPSGSSHSSIYETTGRTLSVAAGRISYTFGFQGPCMTIDTACSSSLVALHSARRSLQLGEYDTALVVGINLLTAQASMGCALADMLSPDGKCHTFDEAANGYCRAEGCGAMVLKRLQDAQRDGDRIYAVIKGSAVMQDGKSASLTAPNGLAQEQLLRAALQDAKLQPRDIAYIEAHGTGTKLGDPIEVEAIAAVYGHDRSADHPLYVSGAKANFGHLEAAAGMLGLFAVMASFCHEELPRNAQP